MNDLAPVVSVYHCAAICELDRQRVRHELFGTFCLRLQRFQTALGDTVGDGYWRPILRYLCRFRYLASATPSAFDDPALFSPQTCRDIRGLLTLQGRDLYPVLAAQALALLQLHQDIAATTTNPLLNAITERLTGASVVLVRETGLIARAKLNIGGVRPSVHIVGPQYLKGLTCVDHLIVVGPTRWYPEYVFTAPRAKRIDVLHFSWMRDKRIEPISFIAKPTETKQGFLLQYQGDTEEMIDADAILPAIDWQQIVQTATTSSDQSQDEVDARLLSLDGGLAVFLEADEQATVRIIDPNSDEQPVQRMAVTELATGMFVLLRTNGGGDYIVPIANRILGANSEAVRAQQQHWKQQLRKLVGIEGMSAVAQKLRGRGSRIASEMNLRNWMAERSIKTAAREDFAAIMEVIGEGTHTTEYWNTMCLIDRAHRRAGFHISKLLLKQVKAADLSELEQRGMLEFTLPDEEGGSITAFRIEQIAPDIYRIPVTRIGHVLCT